MFTNLAGCRGGSDQVGLSAEERRDLQDVHDLARDARPGPRCGRPSAPDAEFRRGPCREFQTALQPGAAKRAAGRAVGLVETGLEDVENAEPRTDFLECGGGLEAEFFTFNHTRSGNEKQPARRSEVFPNGGIVQHADVLAVWKRKVNGAWQPPPPVD